MWFQARRKAVLAFLTSGASSVWAFYQVNQNLTLKDVVMALVSAVIGGTLVHQVRNKTEQ